MLARWLVLSPSILVLNSPTRGVDIGAKSEIAKIISDMADDGCTIIMASSEMEELLLICDRILVMNRGRAKVILERESLTKENLFFYAMS
jgi:ABC-type sugar transport system ATPase subunit